MDRKPSQDFLLFLVGGSLFAAGIFLFTNQVVIGSGFPGLGYGRQAGGFFGGLFGLGEGRGFGLLMVPFGIGVALLLADAYRRVGWFLVWASAAAIGAGVLQSLFFSFRQTSLWSLMAMVVMIAGGGGLMFKSVRGYPGSQAEEQHRRTVEQDESRQTMGELRDELEQLKARMDQR
jgi:hypothetical protein